MEEHAQKRQSEMETNQIKLLAEMQEAREAEQRHEERMMGMMMSVMQQMMAMAAGRYGPHYSAGPGIPPQLIHHMNCTLLIAHHHKTKYYI